MMKGLCGRERRQGVRQVAVAAQRRLEMLGRLMMFGVAASLLAACSNPFQQSSPAYDPLGTPAYDLFGGVSAPAARSVGRFAVGDLEVLDVRETRLPDRYIQKTVYENRTSLPGENYLEATMTTRSTPVWMATPVQGWERPSQDEIALRLREEFPGVQMAISDDLRRNGFGIYNHAAGSAGSRGACVFAWQDATSQRIPAGLDSIFLEFRYCDRERSPQQIVSLFDGLALGF